MFVVFNLLHVQRVDFASFCVFFLPFGARALFFSCNYCPQEGGFLSFSLPFVGAALLFSWVMFSWLKTFFLSLSNYSQQFLHYGLAHFPSKHWISHLTLIPKKPPYFSRYRASRLSVKDWHAMFLLLSGMCFWWGSKTTTRSCSTGSSRQTSKGSCRSFTPPLWASPANSMAWYFQSQGKITLIGVLLFSVQATV